MTQLRNANTHIPSGRYARWRYLCIAVPVGLTSAVAATVGDRFAAVPACVFAVAAASLLLPSSGGGSVLQRVVGIYLCCVPLSQIAAASVTWDIGGHRFQISYLLPALGLLAAGYLSSGGLGEGHNAVGRDTDRRVHGYLLVTAVAALHMLPLALLLGVAYGYGFERSPSVFGVLCAFGFAATVLWRAMASAPCRRVLAGVLIAYFGVAAFTGSGG